MPPLDKSLDWKFVFPWRTRIVRRQLQEQLLVQITGRRTLSDEWLEAGDRKFLSRYGGQMTSNSNLQARTSDILFIPISISFADR
jgi:hypothetical protein